MYLCPRCPGCKATRKKIRRAIYHGMELNAIVCFAAFVGLAAVASGLVPLLFGAKWAAAATLCSMLSIYALVNGLQVFFHPALLASGGAGTYVALNIWHVVGVLVACGIGIEFGVTWLVLGMIINATIIAAPLLWYMREPDWVESNGLLQALLRARPRITFHGRGDLAGGGFASGRPPTDTSAGLQDSSQCADLYRLLPRFCSIHPW